MLGHWLCDNITEMTGVDDGARVNALVELMSRAFLTALQAVDRANELKKDSKLLDLGLVMTVWLEWSFGLSDYGLGEDGEMDWREHVVAYAQKAGIDLRTAGCNSMNRVLNSLEEKLEDEIQDIGPAGKADRWGWKKTVSLYAKC